MLKENTKIFIPNFFTGLSMLVGLISIFYSIKGEYANAGWWILMCTVMDKLDGSAARFLNASTSFGEEFDSLSDFISFGCAPAILVFSYFNHAYADNLDKIFYLTVTAAIYIIFCAVRLAKYNSSMADDKVYFRGLTTTMSGGMIALFMIFSIEHGEFPFLLSEDLIAGMLLAHSCLLLVPFKYPKINFSNKSRPKKYFGIAVLLFCVLLVFMHQLPWLLYGIAVLYVVIGTLKTRKIDLSFVSAELAENEAESAAAAEKVEEGESGK